MDITKIVEAVVALAFAIVTTFIIPWLQTKSKNEKIKIAIDIANQVVHAAHEMQITGELLEIGLSKADYAWTEAKKTLASKNIIIDDDELKTYIKSAVANLRTEFEW